MRRAASFFRPAGCAARRGSPALRLVDRALARSPERHAALRPHTRADQEPPGSTSPTGRRPPGSGTDAIRFPWTQTRPAQSSMRRPPGRGHELARASRARIPRAKIPLTSLSSQTTSVMSTVAPRSGRAACSRAGWSKRASAWSRSTCSKPCSTVSPGTATAGRRSARWTTTLGCCCPISIALLGLDRRSRSPGPARSTLVVAAGEFGRTPRLNSAGGRDHWPGRLEHRHGRRRHSRRTGRGRKRPPRRPSRRPARHAAGRAGHDRSQLWASIAGASSPRRDGRSVALVDDGQPIGELFA